MEISEEVLKKIITEHGLRIEGIGVLLNKFDKLNENLDKISLKLYVLAKEIEKLRNK